MSKYATKQNFQETRYPDIFAPTYWGSFRNDDTSCERVVIGNRNQFVQNYGITEYDGTKTAQRVMRHFRHRLAVQHPCGGVLADHGEAYRTANDELVIIFSPYVQDEDYCFAQVGFERIAPLYSVDCSTYLRKWTSLKAARSEIGKEIICSEKLK